MQGDLGDRDVLNQVNTLGTQLNYYGAAYNYVNNQVQLQQRQDQFAERRALALDRCRLAQGVGAAASLQIRQQLGTQALSIANQAPQIPAEPLQRMSLASGGGPVQYPAVGRGSASIDQANGGSRHVDTCLELRQGEVMIVNGAPIRFRRKTRIELTAKARFLFGKQIMSPEEADSPARRIYFALQTAYIGYDDEWPPGWWPRRARRSGLSRSPRRLPWPAKFSIGR